jgi:hypothetical protein
MNRDDLEQMVDRLGLSKVLFMLAEICHEKADHVETNWQDRVLAADWRKASRAVDRIAETVPVD